MPRDACGRSGHEEPLLVQYANELPHRLIERAAVHDQAHVIAPDRERLGAIQPRQDIVVALASARAQASRQQLAGGLDLSRAALIWRTRTGARRWRATSIRLRDTFTTTDRPAAREISIPAETPVGETVRPPGQRERAGGLQAQELARAHRMAILAGCVPPRDHMAREQKPRLVREHRARCLDQAVLAGAARPDHQEQDAARIRQLDHRPINAGAPKSQG